mgnify:FL=1
MIFSSFQFLIFFSFFLLFIKYFRSQQKVIIILFSLFFYISWNPIFIFLIFYLSLITYICFKKKISTYITLVFIFLPLIYFKYSEFIFNILNYDKLASLSYKSDLPLAISFITFTAVAFIIDAKKKIFNDEISFFSFLEFIIYFPQLIAGPILRAKELVPSLKKKIIFSKNQIKFGIILFTVGFIKKVYLSDSIGAIIDPIFLDPAQAPAEDLIKGFLLFPLQIYFDFSGYVDMALGISNILSIELPVNFNKPYLSKSLTEFWRSWHITLSKWFRDYLYIPLGGSQKSSTILFFNLILTMSIAGLWHGANFNFIIWGFLNGLFLFFEKKISPFVNLNNFFKITINCFIVFNLWLIFRIQDLNTLIDYFRLLYFNLDSFLLRENIFVLTFSILAILSQKYDNYSYIKNLSEKIKLTYFVPIIILIIILGLSFNSGTSDKFIYFDF